MTKIRTQMIRLAYENPELRADLLPLLKTAGLPRATKRPPGKKFRQSINSWINADIQTRFENGGVPQRTIDQYMDAFEHVLFREDWSTKKFYYFETQQEIVDWIAGRFKPPFESEKYLINYSKYLDEAVAKYGQAGNSAIRDKAKAIWNKLKPGQQYLAGVLIFGQHYDAGGIAKKTKDFVEVYIENASKEFIESVLPALEWASKASSPPSINVRW